MRFVLVFLLTLAAMTNMAFAQQIPPLAPDCDPTLPPNSPTGKPCGIPAFIAWIKKLITILLTVAIPIGVIFIVYGAFVIITAGGSEDRFKKGKDIITAAVIGVAIAFGAWLLFTTVNKILTGF